MLLSPTLTLTLRRTPLDSFPTASRLGRKHHSHPSPLLLDDLRVSVVNDLAPQPWALQRSLPAIRYSILTVGAGLRRAEW